MARGDSGNPEQLTHFIPFDEKFISKRQGRALCGALVKKTTQSTEPTCGACRNLLREQEQDIEWLRS